MSTSLYDNRTATLTKGNTMDRNELFDKLVGQYKKGLITNDEFWAEIRERDLMDKVGINEGMAR